MLSPAESNYRIGKFTGSLANAVMNCRSEADLNRIWREKVGLDPPMETTYAMEAGTAMEPVILNFLERETSPITRRGEIVDHPTVPDVCCKLDGFRPADNAIIEVKFLAPYRNKEEFLPAYYGQCCLQMICVGTRNGKLVVGQGTSEPVEHELLFDDDYATELMRRADLFLESMRTMTPPFPEPPIIPPSRWRTIDLDKEQTNWRDELFDHLSIYGDTADAVAAHDEAGKAARELIPADVGTCLIAGWKLNRNKRGVLAITRRK
jgi:hypothetical protein